MPSQVKALVELPGFSPFEHASLQAVSAAEKALGTLFSPDYREAVLAYGAVEIDGHELTGVVSAPRLNVVRVTEAFASLYPHLPKKSYVIEDAGIDGIVVCQDSSGTVYQVSPGGNVTAIARSLIEYLTL